MNGIWVILGEKGFDAVGKFVGGKLNGSLLEICEG
jgi:hypothetical protein